jgi:hypothetical protein
MKRELILIVVAISLGTTALAFADSTWKGPATQTECKFSNGSKIDFGRKALGGLGGLEPGTDVWRTGDYEATPFFASERMHTTPLPNGIDIPSGSYTIFVDTNNKFLWTLIISKKTGWGIPYPGEQYDLGRTRFGTQLVSPEENFKLGCFKPDDSGRAPMFLWMQLGDVAVQAKMMVWATEGFVPF